MEKFEVVSQLLTKIQEWEDNYFWPPFWVCVYMVILMCECDSDIWMCTHIYKHLNFIIFL